MSRPSTRRQILKIRQRFNELIPGRTQGEVYRIIAEEEDENSTTIAAKINMYGYYNNFKKQVISAENKVP